VAELAENSIVYNSTDLIISRKSVTTLSPRPAAKPFYFSQGLKLELKGLIVSRRCRPRGAWTRSCRGFRPGSGRRSGRARLPSNAM